MENREILKKAIKRFNWRFPYIDYKSVCIVSRRPLPSKRKDQKNQFDKVLVQFETIDDENYFIEFNVKLAKAKNGDDFWRI